MNKDLFGEEINPSNLLRDRFIEPPFSILDSRTHLWQKRSKKWKKFGISNENKRTSYNKNNKIHLIAKFHEKVIGGTSLNKEISVFDPVLCEILYHWFCPKGGYILDPFAGGVVRGFVANYLGYKYTGIDLREEQIISNRDTCVNLLDINNQPNYYIGDSDIIMDEIDFQYDFIFSCPPYFNLEIYSNIPGDLSNMDYEGFLYSYKSIINKCFKRLKSGMLCCFVIGDIRDRNGNYIGLVPETIKLFKDAGFYHYNDAIYINSIVGAILTAGRSMDKSKKLRKIHQNILVFKKP